MCKSGGALSIATYYDCVSHHRYSWPGGYVTSGGIVGLGVHNGYDYSDADKINKGYF